MLKNKKRENSSSSKKDNSVLKILQVSSLPWIQVMLVEPNCQTTWKPCSDHAPWSSLIWFWFAKTCLCLKVSCWPKNCQRSSCHCICFQENFCPSNDITIGVWEQLSLCWDRLVNWKETQTMKKCKKIHYWWEPWEILIFQRLLLMTSPSSWDWFRTCSPTLSQKTRNHQTWQRFARRPQRTIWVWFLKRVSLRNVLICRIFLTSDTAVLSLVRQVAVRQQFGKLCFSHWRDTVKTVKLIHWIQRQSTSMNCLAITPSQKSGETVCCQWFWRTRTSASKSTRKLTLINGQFWTVMWTPYGSSHLTLSWMTTRCWHSFLTIEFHWLPQWDFCLKFQTWRTPVQLPSQEVVCFTLMSQISVGGHSSTVGWTGLSHTWKTRRTRFRFIIHQLTKSPRLSSSDASSLTLKPHLICMTRPRLLIWLLHQPWDSFSRFAQFWTVCW